MEASIAAAYSYTIKTSAAAVTTQSPAKALPVSPKSPVAPF